MTPLPGANPTRSRQARARAARPHQAAAAPARPRRPGVSGRAGARWVGQAGERGSGVKLGVEGGGKGSGKQLRWRVPKREHSQGPPGGLKLTPPEGPLTLFLSGAACRGAGMQRCATTALQPGGRPARVGRWRAGRRRGACPRRRPVPQTRPSPPAGPAAAAPASARRPSPTTHSQGFYFFYGPPLRNARARRAPVFG